jgi:hypothetical protein
MVEPAPSTLILKTEDMAATIEWYRAVGFTVAASHPDRDPTWCEVRRDTTALQFVAGETPWPQPPTLTGCIYVYPASVSQVHDEVRGRVEVPWGIEEREWGTSELVLQDPNGYFVTFCEPLDS